MNLFLLKNDKRNYLVATSIKNEGNNISTNRNETNVIYLNENKEVVGFNLLDVTSFCVQEPGRILMTEMVSNDIEKILHIKLPIKNYFVVKLVITSCKLHLS